MKTIAERITARMDEKGLKESDIVTLLNKNYGVKISQPAINKIKTGQTKNPKYIVYIAKVLDCDVDWLLTGMGDSNPQPKRSHLITIEQTIEHRDTVSEDNNPTYISVPTKRIPLISSVQAGEWRLATDQYDNGEYDEYISTTENISGHSFALRISGDSMTSDAGKSLPDGMIVIVDPSVEPTNGRIVIARLESSNEAVIKKLVIDGPNRYLMSLNKSYAPIKINGDCTIIGVVVKGQVDL